MAVNRNETFIPRKNYFGVSPGYIRQMLLQHGLPAEQVEPVAHTMHRLFNKFGADERLNYDVIEKFMQEPHASSRATTFSIAAVDSTDEEKAGADWVCDGVDDQEQIQLAYDTLRDLNKRGEILLLSGHFHTTASVEPSTEAVSIRGLGEDVTFFQATGLFGGWIIDCTINNREPTRLSNFSVIDGGAGASFIQWNLIDTGMTVDHIYFDSIEQIAKSVNPLSSPTIDYYLDFHNLTMSGCGGAGIKLFDFNRRVSGFRFTSNDFWFDSGSTTVDLYMINTSTHMDESEASVIANNTFSYNGRVELHGLFATRITGNWWQHFEIHDSDGCMIFGNGSNGDFTIDNLEFSTVFGNQGYGKFSVTDAENCDITGNVFGESGVSDSITFTNLLTTVVAANKFSGTVTFDAGHHFSVVDNFIYSGDLNINDSAGSGTLVTGNQIDGGSFNLNNADDVLLDANYPCSQIVNAIVLTDSRRCVVSNNLIDGTNIGDHAGATIVLTGDTDNCLVHGNKVTSWNVGKADYFISIGASCNDTKCYGNDGFGRWNTAAVQDLGTGTDLTSANR